MKKCLLWFCVLLMPFVLFDGYHFVRNRFFNGMPQANAYQNKDYYWTYVPNTETVYKNEEGESIPIRSDHYGFRNQTVIKEPDLLLLGDSFVNAANTVWDKTYTQTLNKQGFQIYNAAMDGIGTCHEAYILKDMLEQIHPRVIVLNFYLGNDFLDNFMGPSLDGLSNALASTVEVFQASGAVEHKTEVSWYERLRYVAQVVTRHSPSGALLYRLLRSDKTQSDMAAYDRAEIKVMAYVVKDHPDLEVEKAIANTKKALDLMLTTIERHNQKHKAHTRLVMVGIPSKAQVLKSIREISAYEKDKGGVAFAGKFLKTLDFDQPDRLLREICLEKKIPYYSLLTPFRSHFEELLYYHFDVHWNWRGQQLAGNLVAKWLMGLL